MKYHFILAFFLLACTTAFCQKKYFRTDGYYFYDNGIDTIKACYAFQEEKKIASKQYGFGEGNASCIPDGAIPLEGGTYMHYIAFFDDSTGTAFSQACRNIESFNDALLHIQKRRNQQENTSTAKSQKVYNIVVNNNAFSFEVSKNDYYKELFTGIFYKDCLVLHVKRKFGQSKNYQKKRVYHFYKLNQIPPAVRKQIVVSAPKEDAYYNGYVPK